MKKKVITAIIACMAAMSIAACGNTSSNADLPAVAMNGTTDGSRSAAEANAEVNPIDIAGLTMQPAAEPTAKPAVVTAEPVATPEVKAEAEPAVQTTVPEATEAPAATEKPAVAAKIAEPTAEPVVQPTMEPEVKIETEPVAQDLTAVIPDVVLGVKMDNAMKAEAARRLAEYKATWDAPGLPWNNEIEKDMAESSAEEVVMEMWDAAERKEAEAEAKAEADRQAAADAKAEADRQAAAAAKAEADRQAAEAATKAEADRQAAAEAAAAAKAEEEAKAEEADSDICPYTKSTTHLMASGEPITERVLVREAGEKLTYKTVTVEKMYIKCNGCGARFEGHGTDHLTECTEGGTACLPDPEYVEEEVLVSRQSWPDEYGNRTIGFTYTCRCGYSWDEYR